MPASGSSPARRPEQRLQAMAIRRTIPFELSGARRRRRGVAGRGPALARRAAGRRAAAERGRAAGHAQRGVEVHQPGAARGARLRGFGGGRGWGDRTRPRRLRRGGRAVPGLRQWPPLRPPFDVRSVAGGRAHRRAGAGPGGRSGIRSRRWSASAAPLNGDPMAAFNAAFAADGCIVETEARRSWWRSPCGSASWLRPTASRLPTIRASSCVQCARTVDLPWSNAMKGRPMA